MEGWISETRIMSAVNPDRHFLVNDTISAHYGDFGSCGGSYWCRNSWSFTITSERPEWLRERQNLLIAGGLSDLDQPDEAEITVQIKILEEAPTTHTFNAKIKCRAHKPCDVYRKRDWYVPSTLPEVNSKVLDYISGTTSTDNESWEDIWYVPFRFYRLTKMRLWTWKDSTSGFEVTYSIPDDETRRYMNWPEQVYTFGYKDGTEEPIEALFDKDFKEIQVCVDKSNSQEENRDFEGFKFLQEGSPSTD